MHRIVLILLLAASLAASGCAVNLGVTNSPDTPGGVIGSR